MVHVNATLRSYFWVLHLFLIAVAAYLLADIANLFIASYLEESILIPRASLSQREREVKTTAGGMDYRSIIRGNLFDPTMGLFIPAPPVVRQAPLLQPVVVPPPVVVPKIPLNIRLIGTVVGADNPAYAVIEDRTTRRQTLYRVGDFLLEDAKITKIDRNRVLILRGEEEVVFDLSGVSSSDSSDVVPSVRPVAAPSPTPYRGGGGGIRQMGRDRWMLDRAEIDDAIAHLPELLTKARVVPNFTDGKPDGFRIFAIREDSIYAKIGLQNGDILKRVNDIDVRNPQNFLQVFEQLKNEPRIAIELVRNNKEERFDYNIQ